MFFACHFFLKLKPIHNLTMIWRTQRTVKYQNIIIFFMFWFLTPSNSQMLKALNYHVIRVKQKWLFNLHRFKQLTNHLFVLEGALVLSPFHFLEIHVKAASFILFQPFGPWVYSKPSSPSILSMPTFITFLNFEVQIFYDGISDNVLQFKQRALQNGTASSLDLSSKS